VEFAGIKTTKAENKRGQGAISKNKRGQGAISTYVFVAE
jgi:hypothetical protein